MLSKIDKAWRPARSFQAMIRVRITLNEDGDVDDVEIVKSRDADDFDKEVRAVLNDVRFPNTRDGGELKVTFVFRR